MKFSKDDLIAEGGEGFIYDNKDSVIKIYKKTINIQDKESKLKLLINKTMPINIVKPTELIYDDNKFIGYKMNKVSGDELKSLSNRKFIKTNKITKSNILKMLVDIKNTIKELHYKDIVIGDLNDCNILFDSKFNTYFIDVDSWAIESHKCDVCMDSFRDPKLVSDNFNKSTDWFSFAIIAFKVMTRLHPFGGVMTPDISLMDRIDKGLSVIDRPNVTIPRIADNYEFLSPNLKVSLKKIFETGDRFLIDGELDEFLNNHNMCKICGSIYYSKYNTCPICDVNAKVIVKPQKISTNTNSIPLINIFNKDDADVLFSEGVYLNKQGDVICENKKLKYEKGYRYYSMQGNIIKDGNDKFNLIDKKRGSSISIKEDSIYYISRNNELIKMLIINNSTYPKVITKTANNVYFEVETEKEFCVLNDYGSFKIINVNGYNYELRSEDKILNYGIHYDNTNNLWLVVYENEKSQFKTFVFKNNILEFENDTFKYIGSLSNLCFENKIMFKPSDKKIIAFRFDKNIYKEFECSIVSEDSKLSRRNGKFVIINEKEIYRFG